MTVHEKARRYDLILDITTDYLLCCKIKVRNAEILRHEALFKIEKVLALGE